MLTQSVDKYYCSYGCIRGLFSYIQYIIHVYRIAKYFQLKRIDCFSLNRHEFTIPQFHILHVTLLSSIYMNSKTIEKPSYQYRVKVCVSHIPVFIMNDAVLSSNETLYFYSCDRLLMLSIWGVKGALDNFSLIPPFFFSKKLRFLYH